MKQETQKHSVLNPVFMEAVEIVLLHEGGLVDDPQDSGGITNYGISLKFAKSVGLIADVDENGIVDGEDIKSLTPAQAKLLYHSAFWLKETAYESLPKPIAIKLFNLAVNMGQKQANKLLQRAVRACLGESLADDGVIGSITLNSVKSCEVSCLHAALCSEAASLYRMISAQKPHLFKFLNGWLNRAYSQEAMKCSL